MKPAKAQRRRAGFGLVECVAALAVAGLAILAGSKAAGAASEILRRGRALAEATDVARALLETEIGAPCATGWPCPGAWRCTVVRTRLAENLDRVLVTVTSLDGELREELATLAPPAACGG